jgi:putative Mg2+ transporter-C (MgtC) family protein
MECLSTFTAYCQLTANWRKTINNKSGFLITKVYQYCNSRYRNPTYKGTINTMVDGSFIKGYELDFLIGIGLSLLAGFLIGVERESRGKAAGISTHCFVIAGSMIFTYLSAHVDPISTSRIAAQLVTGIGFLGAGMILKSESDRKITNLTTAAAIWFAASIGMAIGFGFYFMAIVGIAFAVLVPRIPHLSKLKDVADR